MDEGLRRKHPNLFHAVPEAIYQQALAKLSAELPQLDDDQITVQLMRLVATIRDGHTGVNVEFRDGLTHVPLRINMFTDGLFIRAAPTGNAKLVGARITAVGGIPWREAVQQVKELIPCDPGNDGQQDSWPLSLLLTDPMVLHGLNLSSSRKAITYTIEQNGQHRDVTIESSIPPWDLLLFGAPDNWVDAKKTEGIQPFERPWRQRYAFTHVPKNKVLYFQFNNVGEQAGETIADFTKRMSSFIDEHPVERLVIDLRQNPGGDSSALRPLVLSLTRSRLNHRGGLFVLTGPVTFSAAQIFVNRLEDDTDAIFVGEPTGQNRNFYSNPITVTLPNSHLNIDVALLWWQDGDPRDKRAATFPEVFIPSGSFADYLKGDDAALEFALTEPAPTSFEDWMAPALPKGRAAAMQRYKDFIADPRHLYPGNLQQKLDVVGHRLLKQKQLESALSAFQVNAQLHPELSSVYFSLGDGYAAVGKNDEAAKAYRRCVELDPGNWQAMAALNSLSKAQPSTN